MANRGKPYHGARPSSAPTPRPTVAPAYRSAHGADYKNHQWNDEQRILVACDCQNFVGSGCLTLADAQMLFINHLVLALKIQVRQ